MTTRDIRLEIKFWGSILDCRIFLEGNHEVGLWAYNAQKKIYFKELPNYQITGNTLEVKMNAKGKNGASATLTVKIKEQKDETLKCVIENGFSTSNASIAIENNSL